ncbi:MAG: hypothetical protein U0610_30110 [bacterium]
MNELVAKRDALLADERARAAASGAKDSFDSKVAETVREHRAEEGHRVRGIEVGVLHSVVTYVTHPRTARRRIRARVVGLSFNVRAMSLARREPCLWTVCPRLHREGNP